MKNTYPAIPVAKAQKRFPELCRSGRSFLITNRDTPTAVLIPIEDYEAIMESMELLSDPESMKVLRAAKSGKLKYKELDLEDENFGLR